MAIAGSTLPDRRRTEVVSLLILGVVVGWVVLWVYVFKHAPNRGVRVGAVLVAVLVPFWDLPIGYFNFQLKCHEFGGLRIEAKHPPVRAILVEDEVGYKPEQLIRYGFSTVEFGERPHVLRYTAIQNSLVKSTHEDLLSTVKIHVVRNQILDWNLVRRDLLISRINDARVIARHTDFHWLGLWWQREASPTLGDGGRCFASNETAVLTRVAAGT